MPARESGPGGQELDAVRQAIDDLRRGRLKRDRGAESPRSEAAPAASGQLPLELASITTSTELVGRLLSSFLEQVGAGAGTVWLADPECPSEAATTAPLAVASRQVACVVAETLPAELLELVASTAAPIVCSTGHLAAVYQDDRGRPAAALAAPLAVPGGPPAGGIYLESARPFAPAQIEIFRRLAGQASLIARQTLRGLELERRLKALEARSDLLSQLHRISEVLASAPDLSSVLQLAMDQVIEVTHGERGFLMLKNDFGELAFEVARNKNRENLTQGDFRVSGSITRQVAETGAPEYIVDALSDERFGSQASILDLQLRTIVCVPLRLPTRTIGVIYVDSRAVCHPHTAGDLDFFAAVAATAAVAIENARLTEERIRSEQLSTIGRMASTIIHDLKGPLSTIRGYAQLIERKPEGPKTPRYAGTILEEVDRMVDMTREVLEFSRGAGQLDLQELAVDEQLADVAGHLSGRDDVREKAVRIGLEPGCPGVRVRVDRGRLLRVFENLAANAVAAVQPGGSIVIRSLPHAGGVEIDVIDDGCGMPEAVRRRAFEPFVTHGKVHGTGLGLAIVRRIVLAHRGNIEVESQEGQGTRFRIILPEAGP